jgi:hypothetical protein
MAAPIAILLTLLAGCSQAGSSQSGRSSAPATSSTEAPGGVPSTTDPAFDDRTWRLGDCLHEPANNQEMEATHASYWKVSCSASNAMWRIKAVLDASASAQACYQKMTATDPLWSSNDPGSVQVLSALYGTYCLDTTRSSSSLVAIPNNVTWRTQRLDGKDVISSSDDQALSPSFARGTSRAQAGMAPRFTCCER